MDRLEFEENVYNWIQKQDMISPGDGVIVGVSGGADSVALLLFLCRMRKKMQITLRCIHVEHGIRGEESMSDALFVDSLCKDLGVPCEVVSAGAQIAHITDTHMSLEEKARQVRYDVLSDGARTYENKLHRPVRIALAHHRDDNVETMLFHLARGTGLDGMRGIPVKRGMIVRPFLCVGRKDIEVYLQENNQPYRTDTTNLDIAYDRNRIRHQIIPELKTVNDKAVPHMNQAAFLLGEVADYIGEQARQVLQKATVIPPQEGTMGELDGECLLRLPELMKREVIHLWLQQYIPGAKDIGAVHIYSIAELLDAQVGRQLSLPKRMLVWRTYKGIAIGNDNGDGNEKSTFVVVSHDSFKRDGDTLQIRYGKYQIKFRRRIRRSQEEIPRNLYTKWFDYDKIKNDMQIRERYQGDYLLVSQSGARKKLQDYFVNEKIPAASRDEIPLLCEDNHVIWAIGYRISEYYKIDDNTKHVLEVQFLEERENE